MRLAFCTGLAYARMRFAQVARQLHGSLMDVARESQGVRWESHISAPLRLTYGSRATYHTAVRPIILPCDCCATSMRPMRTCAYEHFSSAHSMCQTVTGTEIPLSQADEDNIVSNHNRIRNEVQPPASNMQLMVWDDELALIALTYAKQCRFSHDLTVNRQALGLPGSTVGQNIYFRSNTFDPVAGVVSWEDEKADFTYNTANTFSLTGHYSEMILHRNAKVGCGVADCSVPGIENRPGLNYIMICNYGAIQTNDEPDKPYCSSSISTCDTCGSTDPTYTNLCACGGKSCFNGGTLDIATCQCTCANNFGHTILTGSLCETLTCGATSEGTTCSVTDCETFGFTFGAKFCPATCKVCPNTCTLNCQNGGYLNYVSDQTETRCACYCPTGFTGTECATRVWYEPSHAKNYNLA
ncbi:cysteine-rich venom protein-like [Gigantopelta aegis]|uniref:cysteine-rich venom protein-like n=1 Tax=Gigantopelta aegis TaxID=1735272 RepID=UPI001B887FB9|nr:cysteine-rich venom protein-like [Gigantopelta aegis]